jgi:elongation factor P
MIGYSDLRHGIVIEIDGEPWQVLEYQHNRMQQRAPVLSLKLKHLKTGRIIDRNLPGNQKLVVAQVEQRQAQYLYSDDGIFYFMDMESYDHYPLTQTQLGDTLSFIKEQATVEMTFYRGNPISVELPTYVELRIEDTPPGVKGNTVQGGTKPATLETGLVVQVPLFINPGELVRIDTRSSQYLERA